MSIEQQVQNLIDGAVDELTVPELHELLVRAAEISGGKPRAATGPGTQFIWRLGNRGQTIRVGRFRGGKLSLSRETFDWAERDDQEYRDFKWGEAPNLPYLWRLPIAGGSEWGPGEPLATSWRAFFSCFEQSLDRLPSDLQLIPPAWRPAGKVVISMWNIDGRGCASVSVAVSATGITMEGCGDEPFLLEIPADRLGPKQVSVPAILASLTATGDYRELQFFENETAMDVFPTGMSPDDPMFDPDDFPHPGTPKQLQTVDQARALLTDSPELEPTSTTASADPASTKPVSVEPAAPVESAPPLVIEVPAAPEAPARKPWWRRRAKASATTFVSTMPPEHAVELAGQLALNNHDVPAVLEAWGTVLDERSHGVLRLGFVQCQRSGVGYDIAVELMPTGQDIDDLSGATAYARQLKDGLRARFGGQQAQFASLTTGSFAWQVGSVGLVLELDAKRVALVVVADGNRAVSLVQALSQPPT